MRVIKLRTVHSIYSKRMLAKYMRHIRNNNLEIRIAGSSCRPQLVSRKMLRPIFGDLFLSLVVTFCMLCLINILSLNCFCAIKHILIFFYYFYSLNHFLSAFHGILNCQQRLGKMIYIIVHLLSFLSRK